MLDSFILERATFIRVNSSACMFGFSSLMVYKFKRASVGHSSTRHTGIFKAYLLLEQKRS